VSMFAKLLSVTNRVALRFIDIDDIDDEDDDDNALAGDDDQVYELSEGSSQDQDDDSTEDDEEFLDAIDYDEVIAELREMTESRPIAKDSVISNNIPESKVEESSKKTDAHEFFTAEPTAEVDVILSNLYDDYRAYIA
jgi:hypothetical protein